MNDLISRAAAIDLFLYGKEMLNLALDDMDVVGTEREKYSWGLGLIESTIKDIEELPSAEPEIIRCMECKHRHEAECPMYHEEDIEWDDDGYIERETICHDWTEDDGYCDRGERRTDE